MKNKKNIFILIAIAVVLSVCSVGGYLVYQNINSKTKEVNKTEMQEQVKFATVKAYYHSVEKLKTDKTFIPIIWKTHKDLWFEFTTTVTVGVDVNKMKFKKSGKNITVYLPEAEMLEKPVVEQKNLTKKNLITNKTGFLVSDIDAEDQLKVVKKAQTKAKRETLGNKPLLEYAKNRAKTLIRRYINSVNDLSEENYKITFKNL